MNDYARQCDDIWDLQQKAAEVRQGKLEEAKNSIVENDCWEIMSNLYEEMTDDEIEAVAKAVLLKDESTLGHILLPVINRTGIAIAELGED